jgi:hypothetical protein
VINCSHGVCCLQTGNKGACAVSWTVCASTGLPTRFLAICCHLEAHTHKLHKRNANARHILYALHLQPPPSPQGLTQTVFSSFFPSLSSPLRGRSRRRALSPGPSGELACASPPPPLVSERSRGQSLPSAGVGLADGARGDVGRLSPLCSSIESASSWASEQRQRFAQSGRGLLNVRRSVSMPGDPSGLGAVQQRQLHVESLGQWDIGAAHAACIDSPGAGPEPALLGDGGGWSRSGSDLGGRPAPKELTPVSEGQEGSSSGATDSGGGGIGSDEQSRYSQGRGWPRTPHVPASLASSGAHPDSLNVWRTPVFGAPGHAGAPRSALHLQSTAASTASFDFARSRAGASSRTEAPTPRLASHLSPRGIAELSAMSPFSAATQPAHDASRHTPPVLSHLPGARWAGARGGVPICEGASGRDASLVGSECSSMHTGIGDKESPHRRTGELTTEAVPMPAPEQERSGSLGETSSDAGARAYLACMARLEAAGASSQPAGALEQPNASQSAWRSGAGAAMPPPQQHQPPAAADWYGDERLRDVHAAAASPRARDSMRVPIADANCWGCPTYVQARFVYSKLYSSRASALRCASDSACLIRRGVLDSQLLICPRTFV